jgi:TatD family hydrolase
MANNNNDNKTNDKMPPRVVDIGINLTNAAFRKHWRAVVRRAIDAGVDRILLTGTSLKRSRESLDLAQQWHDETGCPNLYVTVGVHPHDAKTWNKRSSESSTREEMKALLEHPLAVAVGECGLDYNRNFSSKQDQLYAFREQVKLACELNMPLFLHEREAHEDFVGVFDEILAASGNPVPHSVVDCFTGTKEEAEVYVQRGFYIGFTGTICKQERGTPLRALLPSIPPNRLMVETDAPFMGFKKGRRSSEPADCADVARKLGETIGVPFEDICEITTSNALNLFPGMSAG